MPTVKSVLDVLCVLNCLSKRRQLLVVIQLCYLRGFSLYQESGLDKSLDRDVGGNWRSQCQGLIYPIPFFFFFRRTRKIEEICKIELNRKNNDEKKLLCLLSYLLSRSYHVPCTLGANELFRSFPVFFSPTTLENDHVCVCALDWLRRPRTGAICRFHREQHRQRKAGCQSSRK